MITADTNAIVVATVLKVRKKKVCAVHVAIGPDRFKKSYTGSPGVSGTRAPRLPKIVQPKTAQGTAKGAHELPGTSLFGGPGFIRR